MEWFLGLLKMEMFALSNYRKKKKGKKGPI